MNLQDFLNFRQMMTPLLIKILFWVGVGISVLLGVGSIFGGVIRGISNDSLAAVAGGLCTGPLIIVVGILGQSHLSQA